MNRIHRIIFNRATGLRQVVSELAKSRGARTTAAGAIVRGILLLSLALAGATSAWSDGGDGGAGGVLPAAVNTSATPGVAGEGGSSDHPNGGPGGDASKDRLGSYLAGGGGGGGGAVDLNTGQAGLGGSGGRGLVAGGAGGASGAFAVIRPAGPIGPVAIENGAPGTAGSSDRAGVSGGGGGGGEGGGGILLDPFTSGSSTLGATLSGGAGGQGGAGAVTSSGGSGGDGGVGIAVVPLPQARALDLTIGTNATVRGGTGGAGGAAGRFGDVAGAGGDGGNGGTGIVGGPGTTITNTGRIVGGTPGLGDKGEVGSPLPESSWGRDGRGGVGIVARGTVIDNTGRIEGGLNADRATRASAVQFVGDAAADNRLVMHSGSTVQGAVEITSGSAATLETRAGADIVLDALVLGGPAVIGGASGSTLAVGAGKVSGAGALVKVGDSSLVLSGSNTYQGGTTVQGGALFVANDASLGLESAPLVLEGASLYVLEPTVSRRPWTVNGSAVSLLRHEESLTLSAPLSLAGNLAKAGAGNLVLAAPADQNFYEGIFTIVEGNVVAAAADVLSDSTTVVLSNPATGLKLAGFDQHLRSLAGSGKVDLGSATLSLGRFGSPDDRFSGSIAGTGGLVKEGSGTLTLTGTSTYSGGTELTEGRIDVGSAQALGTGRLAIAPGAGLGFAADGLTLKNPIELGPPNAVADSSLIDTGATSQRLDGVVSGEGGLRKAGTGTLVLGASNVYGGPTTIAEGTVRAGKPAAFSGSSVHVVEAGAVLETGGFDQRLAGLVNRGTVSLMGAAPGSSLVITGPYRGEGTEARPAVVLLGSHLDMSRGASV